MQTDLTVLEFLYRTIDSYWRDAKVIGNFVFIVSEAPDHGLQVREEKMHNLLAILHYT